MVDIAALQSAIGGLKTAGDLAKSFLDIKASVEINSKVLELQSTILSAQSSALEAQSTQTAMIDEIRTLKEEIARIKAWETQKQRYKLVSPWAGSVTYALKESMSDGEPPHYICTTCYENGRKSILTPRPDKKDYLYNFACPVCKTEVPTPWAEPSAPKYATD